MSDITICLTAATDVGVYRKNNEDNFIVCPDVSVDNWTIPQDPNGVIPLGPRGSLIVVADGMGGMNAGEVASDIAVHTVKDCFAPDKVTPEDFASPAAACKFMKQVILEADNRIKKHAKKHSDTSGMGTTIVMAWLLDNTACVAWCGDSRAYAFHPDTGLRQLSKDHSYVQSLVDSGQLLPELAFDHPDSNIITSSLGDFVNSASPDSVVTYLHNGEMLLLCSDGLCGMIRDNETEHILQQTHEDLDACRQALIQGALNAGGHDNVTIALLKVLSGAPDLPPVTNTPTRTLSPTEIEQEKQEIQAAEEGSDLNELVPPVVEPKVANDLDAKAKAKVEELKKSKKKGRKFFWTLFILLLLAGGLYLLWRFVPGMPFQPKQGEEIDSTQIVNVDTIKPTPPSPEVPPVAAPETPKTEPVTAPEPQKPQTTTPKTTSPPAANPIDKIIEKQQAKTATATESSDKPQTDADASGEAPESTSEEE